MSSASALMMAVRHRVLAGDVSPLSVFEMLYGRAADAFLYESLAGGSERGRYSFLGGRPRLVFESRGRHVVLRADGVEEIRNGDPLVILREVLSGVPDGPPVAPFAGGAVGYFAYDIVRQFETISDNNPDDLELPDTRLVVPDEIIVIDHVEKRTHVILHGEARPDREREILDAISAARQSEEAPPSCTGDVADMETDFSLQSNMTPAEYEAAVERAKEYIRAGDIFQVVLSQRFEFPYASDPLSLYRALRITNPSPYMYYLAMGDHHVLGSSPEVLVKLVERRVTTRPLAGTRRRGSDERQDAALAAELRADPKENAEHVMLVDLARNDIGRVCTYGSVRAGRLLEVERYPQVMHLVSDVEGELRTDRDGLDLIRAAFPAGTVSGAPKCRAMEMIDELEPSRRGLYAGAIGYVSGRGDLDLCIAIRTIVLKAGRGFIQAGAGIVADSDPRREYEETLNKARALMQAVRLAGGAA